MLPVAIQRSIVTGSRLSFLHTLTCPLFLFAGSRVPFGRRKKWVRHFTSTSIGAMKYIGAIDQVPITYSKSNAGNILHTIYHFQRVRQAGRFTPRRVHSNSGPSRVPLDSNHN